MSKVHTFRPIRSQLLTFLVPGTKLTADRLANALVAPIEHASKVAAGFKVFGDGMGGELCGWTLFYHITNTYQIFITYYGTV